MRLIKAGTKQSKFTVDAVKHENVYFFPDTLDYRAEGLAINGCYYNRNRAKWLEDTFYPTVQLASDLVTFI